jgi:hypothetical protein
MSAHPEDQWTVATSEENGCPLIVRFRSEPPQSVTLAEYPHLIVVQWLYEESHQSGLPTGALTDQMATLEKLLDLALETPRVAFNTAVITGDGVREWQWYARDVAEFMALANAGLAGQPVVPVSFINQGPDPTWSTYLEITGSAT